MSHLSTPDQDEASVWLWVDHDTVGMVLLAETKAELKKWQDKDWSTELVVGAIMGIASMLCSICIWMLK